MVAFMQETPSPDDIIVAETCEVVVWILEQYTYDVMAGVPVPPFAEVAEEIGCIVADMPSGEDA